MIGIYYRSILKLTHTDIIFESLRGIILFILHFLSSLLKYLLPLRTIFRGGQ